MIVRKICRLQGCVPKRLGIRCALVLLFPVCSVSSLCSIPIVHWIPSRYRQIADRLVCFCGRRGGLWQDRPTNRVPGSYDISVGKCHQCHERWANPQSVIRAFGYTFHVVHITFRPVSSTVRQMVCRSVLPWLTTIATNRHTSRSTLRRNQKYNVLLIFHQKTTFPNYSCLKKQTDGYL